LLRLNATTIQSPCIFVRHSQIRSETPDHQGSDLKASLTAALPAPRMRISRSNHHPNWEWCCIFTLLEPEAHLCPLPPLPLPRTGALPAAQHRRRIRPSATTNAEQTPAERAAGADPSPRSWKGSAHILEPENLTVKSSRPPPALAFCPSYLGDNAGSVLCIH
jgi:hypothetical protein